MEEEDKIILYFSVQPFYISNHSSNASSNEEEKEEVVWKQNNTFRYFKKTVPNEGRMQSKRWRRKKTCTQFENSFYKRARKHDFK